MEIIRVLAAVIQRHGRYLICRRPAHKRHGGLWEFPGGKLGAGESLSAAAHRELMEELDVGVSEVGVTLAAIQDPGSPFQIEFVEVEIIGEPRALDHDELRWVRLSDAAELELAPCDAEFIRSQCVP